MQREKVTHYTRNDVFATNSDSKSKRIIKMYCFFFSFYLFQAALRSSDKSPLETALTEFKKLEGRCGVETGGWMTVFKRRLFPTIDVTVTDYDRQIVLADACMSIAFLSIAMHEQQSVGVTAKAAYLVRRAWKTYHQCYVAVLEVYRGVFDLGPGIGVGSF